jgi:hypothetical protein
MNSERATAAEVDAGDCGVAHGFVFFACRHASSVSQGVMTFLVSIPNLQFI